MPRAHQALTALRTFKPLTSEQIATLLALAQDGRYEQFKTTTNFDGTIQNPQWLT